MAKRGRKKKIETPIEDSTESLPVEAPIEPEAIVLSERDMEVVAQLLSEPQGPNWRLRKAMAKDDSIFPEEIEKYLDSLLDNDKQTFAYETYLLIKDNKMTKDLPNVDPQFPKLSYLSRSIIIHRLDIFHTLKR